MIKKTIQKIIGGGRLRGFLEFVFLFERHKDPWNGPFNGQEIRKKIYLDIIRNCGIEKIIETGCFRGATTDFFACSGLEVNTCEIQPRFYIFSKLRFFGKKNTKVCHSDSRSFLRCLSNKPSLVDKRCFFYLDAHWEGDLPLREEIQIILENWANAVIMVDDFKVPGDDGYKYDNYGKDKVLDLNYLSVLKFNVTKFFPINSRFETGRKRGSIVLTNNAEMSKAIVSSEYLNRFAS